ncbi:MAG: hypothetical protein ABSE67_16445 [Xanthobacteraceae bacterium]|jgi:hypothetical protein
MKRFFRSVGASLVDLVFELIDFSCTLLRDRGGLDKLADELGQGDANAARYIGAKTTLGHHRATPWVWLHCEGCRHYSPLACAVAVIGWGADTSSDKLRRSARRAACGHSGAIIQHPGWGGR